jgi:hypothetical protein
MAQKWAAKLTTAEGKTSGVLKPARPKESIDEATEAGRAAFSAARTPQGDYVMHTEMRFTIARRATD